jgi:hypothetical protein
MPIREMGGEIAAGVEFWGYDAGGVRVAVIGFQSLLDIDLIRHA